MDCDDVLDDLPPSRELIGLYKSKLERCRHDYANLAKQFEMLKVDVLNTGSLERELTEAREGLSKMNDVFSRTQALLMLERRQSQQLALQVDLFQKQHEVDREKLDLLLSLNGGPVPQKKGQQEDLLRSKVLAIENVLKEQAAELLEERNLLKCEWDKDRQAGLKRNKQLSERVNRLQDELVRASQRYLDAGGRSIDSFLEGDMAREVVGATISYSVDEDLLKDRKPGHCADQEMKRLKRMVDELQHNMSIMAKKNQDQGVIVRELNDQLKKTKETCQSQTKALKDQLSRSQKQCEDLNKRRLNEGAGFRSEIHLLRQQLERTQRQLTYLAVKKLDE